MFSEQSLKVHRPDVLFVSMIFVSILTQKNKEKNGLYE